jgi:hypothetical protein
MKKKIILSVLGLLLCFGGLVQATINSNSKVLDGIEYYVQTDKFTYQLGEHVEMLYKITNLSEQSITFTLPQSPVWNFWAEKDDSQIWQAVNGWWLEITPVTLAPGQSRQFPDLGPPFLWDLRDSTGNIVGIGNYDIIGGLYGPSGNFDYTKVSVPIVIIPEPASLIFLAIGLPVVRTFLRRKR